MQNVILSLLINGLMAALLLATMIYCRKLNGRIKILQDSKSELARIIREFDECTTRATESIAQIHVATNRISDNIQHKIDKANFLADDLQYMIEKSQKVAVKLDPTGAYTTPMPTPTAAAAADISAARLAPKPASTAFVIPDAPAPSARPSAGAEAPARGGRVRSRAEQEIMSALSAKNTSGE